MTVDVYGGWGEVEKKVKESEDRDKVKGISRLNPRNGVSYDVVFLTDNPVTVWEHFVGSRNSPICTLRSDGNCRVCETYRDNKPNFKGYFLVLNRSYTPREQNALGDWVDKVDPKTGKTLVEPRLQIICRGQRDLSTWFEHKSRYGLLGKEFELIKKGEGQSSAVALFDKERDKQAKLTKAERDLIGNRNPDEFRKLIMAMLRLGSSDMPLPKAENQQVTMKEVDWADTEAGDDDIPFNMG